MYTCVIIIKKINYFQFLLGWTPRSVICMHDAVLVYTAETSGYVETSKSVLLVRRISDLVRD